MLNKVGAIIDTVVGTLFDIVAAGRGSLLLRVSVRAGEEVRSEGGRAAPLAPEGVEALTEAAPPAA